LDNSLLNYTALPAPRATARFDSAEHLADTIGRYVQVHNQHIMESLWFILKRGYVGTYHKLSTKHLQRYMGEWVSG